MSERERSLNNELHLVQIELALHKVRQKLITIEEFREIVDWENLQLCAVKATQKTAA